MMVTKPSGRAADYTSAIVLVASVVLGCSRPCSDNGTRADASTSTTTAMPRYWLVGTVLSLDTQTGATREVKGPVLVELLPGGRVRSLPGGAETFEGILPDAVLHEPQDGHGLMLYAQRVGDIHIDRPSGPVVGRLHPGAFVSVAPFDDTHVRIGNLGFHTESPSRLSLYIERTVLGVEPVPLSAPIPPKGAQAFVTGLRLGLSISTDAPLVDLIPCHDIWYTKSFTASQWVGGVELRGYLDWDMPRYGWRASTYSSLPCEAHTVSASGGRLFLTQVGDKDGAASIAEISAIPEGYARVTLPDPDLLAARVERGGSVYWLRDDADGVTCEGWTFVPVRKITDAPSVWQFDVRAMWRMARMVRREPVSPEGTYAWYPVGYVPRRGDLPARIHLSSLRYGARHAPIKCDCPYTYRVLGGEGDEIHVMGRHVTPDNVIAYDPGDAERWFLSEESCEAARRQVDEVIKRNGATATRVGFHPVEMPGLH